MFGSRNERLVKNYTKSVARINALEAEISALSDEQLRGKTDEFRQRIKDGATVHDLLPEAFAVVREAGKRVLNMRHFDVQLIGGIGSLLVGDRHVRHHHTHAHAQKFM